MFITVETGKCPACCTAGRRMDGKTDVFQCPACRAVFSEFGMVINPQESSAEQQMA